MSFSDLNNDGAIATTEVLQQTVYYPFGLDFTLSPPASQIGAINPYKYNGILQDNDFNLNVYSALYRNLDPVIGRWWQVDPLADNAPHWTSYRFGFDNPVNFSDPSGLWETDKEGNVSTTDKKEIARFMDFVNTEKKLTVDNTLNFVNAEKEEEGSGRLSDGGILTASIDIISDKDGSFSTDQNSITRVYNEVQFKLDHHMYMENVVSGYGDDNGNQNQLGLESWEHAVGPGLYAAGQPLNALKPIGALGSKPGSSIASKTLSKAFPQTFTKVLGKEAGTKVATRIGTNVIGRALGRLVPFAGWSLTVYDAGTFMYTNQSSFQQGMQVRDQYIQQGLIPLR